VLALLIVLTWLSALLLVIVLCRGAHTGDVQLELIGELAQTPSSPEHGVGASERLASPRAL